MVVILQAFLSPPLKPINNCTVFIPPLLCFINCPWKYMGGKISCHSASRVSWDMQGLLFVLETQELY